LYLCSMCFYLHTKLLTRVFFENVMFFRLEVYATRTSGMQAYSNTTSGKYVFLCIVFVNCDYLFNRYMHLEVTIYMVYIAFLAGYFSILDCHRHIYPYWSCFAYCFTRCTLECNTVFFIFCSQL
jgi:hypothetical protein